ncbi:MAG: sulfatase-like hydrolase/transferase, partial [Verrucomicrobiota bacterium]
VLCSQDGRSTVAIQPNFVFIGNSPVCMPSRQSFMSGQYPWALGLTANGQEMPEDVACIQHLLGRAGYHTAQIGKLHFTNIQHSKFRIQDSRFGIQSHRVVFGQPGGWTPVKLDDSSGFRVPFHPASVEPTVRGSTPVRLKLVSFSNRCLPLNQLTR